MNWLEQIAPTIATVLGGPLAGLAVSAVSKAMGVSEEDAKSMMESGKMTAEQLAQIKLAEIDLKKQEKELGVNFEKMAVEDRKSARDMQAVTKSVIPAVLATVITLGFFGVLLSLMYGEVSKTNEVMIMLGALGAAWTGVVSFYFGSSAGSQKKDAMIYSSTPTDEK